MIKNIYHSEIAVHYAAYRPPLHSDILSRVIQSQRFTKGLDIGSGTGHSTLALANFCEETHGLEPSRDMLKLAISNVGVQYHIFDTTYIPFPNDTFDVITFAGSLFYCKSQKILDEVLRVSNPTAIIIVYDFEVLMTEILAHLDFLTDIQPLAYDHTINFSGLEEAGIVEDYSFRDQAKITVSPLELSHLLLSDHQVYQSIVAQKLAADPLLFLSKWMGQKLSETISLTVNLYCTRYLTSRDG